ncbi:helix-turn-helix domain-containing protein [Streptomyces bambusae]|uniref:helix-turn-helix transcriptional regulator n=1 Tax=Streptomyces bambusae TaxID=1550616 RepID=UPI001CFD014A|nr:helix-turn-helix transcriptional regulator [Streptomyces bambusae]MCB5167979.1 helix-turn-helix domain-containing protein [Streptomyces bambusae]
MGDNLRDARTTANMSQEHLAELAGIDRKTVSRIEGATSDARLSVWLRLADALGVPLAYLVRDE